MQDSAAGYVLESTGSAVQNDAFALHAACKKGNLKKVRHLILAESDVNAPDNDSRFPIHYAAYNGQIDIVQMLIEYGADVNATEINGQTPLHIAAEHGHLPVVQLFIDSGAQVNAANNFEVVPLHYAAGNGHIDVMKTLLKGQLSVKRLPSFKVESLQNIWLYTFLNDRAYDDTSIIEILNHLRELNISFNKFINIKLFKNALQHRAARAPQNKVNNEINLMSERIDDYCNQYLQHIKKEINDKKIIANMYANQYPDLVELFKAINSAHCSFDELPEDLQDIIYDPDFVK